MYGPMVAFDSRQGDVLCEMSQIGVSFRGSFCRKFYLDLIDDRVKQ